jgi:exopolysaccharide production protein ExoF
MERLRTMTLQTKQLLARRARLEAERDGVSTLPVPIQLAKLAGEKNAQTFLATESTILRAEQARRQQQRREIASRLAATRNEVEALKSKLEQSEVQKEMRIERLNDLQKLKDRGLVTSNNVVALRTELSDIEARRQDYLVAIVQAEARLVEAEEASPRLSSEIAAAQETMISARTLATILYKPNGGTPQAEAYEIVRQSRDGARTFPATETSPLMPGDVLKITSGTGAINPTSISPIPQSGPPAPYISAANKG